MKTFPSDPKRIVRDALIAGMLPWVKSQARRMVRRDSRLDFDDLVQAGSIALLEAADDFDDRGCFFLHARTPIRWRMKDQAKAARRQPAHADGVDRLCASQPTQLQLAERGEIRAALAAILTRPQAIVFTFYFVEHCSAREIGDLVGISRIAVTRMLSSLTRRLAADPRLRALAGVPSAPTRTPGEVKQRLNGSVLKEAGQRTGNGSPRTDAGLAQEGHEVRARPHAKTVRGCSPGTFSREGLPSRSLTTGGPSTPQQSEYCVSSPRRRIARAGGAFTCPSPLLPRLSA